MTVKTKIVSCSDNVEIEYSDGVITKYIFNGNDYDISEQENEIKAFEKVGVIVNNFASHYDNMLVLTGAGSSMLSNDDITNVGINIEDREMYSGKSMWTLRTAVDSELLSLNLFSLNELAELVKYPYRVGTDDEIFNLEDFLSNVDRSKDFIPEDKIEKFDQSINAIESAIRKNCTLKLCDAHCHRLFLDKVTSRRKTQNRVKIFTTNYDTLFEEASEQDGYILVDGFSFTKNRKFSSDYFDYDFVHRSNNKIPDEPRYVDRVIQLLKIHGSIDWYKDPTDGNVYKSTAEILSTDPLMIYPRRGKFEQSYDKPYFELFSRFQQELRKQNTLLIVIGFSFGDKHIKSIVEEAVSNNPGLKVLVVSPTIAKDEFEFLSKRAKQFENTMLLSATFKEFTEKIYKKQTAFSNDLFDVGGE